MNHGLLVEELARLGLEEEAGSRSDTRSIAEMVRDSERSRELELVSAKPAPGAVGAWIATWTADDGESVFGGFRFPPDFDHEDRNGYLLRPGDKIVLLYGDDRERLLESEPYAGWELNGRLVFFETPWERFARHATKAAKGDRERRLAVVEEF